MISAAGYEITFTDAPDLFRVWTPIDFPATAIRPQALPLTEDALASMDTYDAIDDDLAAGCVPGPYDAQLAAGGALAETLAPIDNLTRAITVAFYAAVIAGTLIAQGCTAGYYYSRRAHMIAYLRNTPTWIIELLRTAAK